MSTANALNGDSETVFCSRCGSVNHDVYDGVLDCGHSLDDGAWLEAAGNEPVIAGILALANRGPGSLPEELIR